MRKTKTLKKKKKRKKNKTKPLCSSSVYLDGGARLRNTGERKQNKSEKQGG